MAMPVTVLFLVLFGFGLRIKFVLDRIEARLKRLELAGHMPFSRAEERTAERQPEPVSPAPEPAPETPPSSLAVVLELPPQAAERTPLKREAEPQPDQATQFEHQFGARLPVWIGGIALALGGFFLVRYAIEIGLLTQTVRVILGLGFGFALIGAGYWVRNRPALANGTRIAQVLTGAGIADLYASLFVATTLYHLIPSFAGFAAMVAVTIAAVALSLRHGAPIAAFGLAGGYLTPILTGAHDPNAPLLFLYLYALLAGFFVVIRRQGWWSIAIPALLAAFAWVGLWMLGPHHAGDSNAVMLFLVASMISVAAASDPVYREGHAQVQILGRPLPLHHVAVFGSVLLAAIVARMSGFGLVDWSLFWVLSAAVIGLAAVRPETYGDAPWASLAASLIMLLSWRFDAPAAASFASVLGAFALLNGAAGYALMWHSYRPLQWGSFAAAAGFGYFIVAYLTLSQTVSAWTAFPLWGTIAAVLALICVRNVMDVRAAFADGDPVKNRLLTIYAALALAFPILGAAIELHREMLAVVIAAETFGLAWVGRRFHLSTLRPLAFGLLVVFGLVAWPDLARVIGWLGIVPLPSALALGLEWGVPAALFGAASFQLRAVKDDETVRAVEVLAIGLTASLAYHLTRQSFTALDHGGLLDFTARGAATNLFFAFGLLCLAVGKRFDRIAVYGSGLALSGLAAARVVLFDLAIFNPLWSHELVGAWPLVNALLLPFGFPLLWIWLTQEELPQTQRAEWQPYLSGFALILLFTLVTLDVRQLYWGRYLESGMTTSAEVYSYSAAWLLLGIGLLVIGTLRKDQALRVASLGMMLLSAGKVFLYDAAELAGLFRVFSFFGLGVVLIALSWFYTRFVFADAKPRGV